MQKRKIVVWRPTKKQQPTLSFFAVVTPTCAPLIRFFCMPTFLVLVCLFFVVVFVFILVSSGEREHATFNCGRRWFQI